MYELYRDVCTSSNKQPVKESFYRSVFCQHYNLSFHIPRKDRCDFCEEVKMKINEGTLTDQRRTDYEKHIEEKNAARAEKQKDRDNGNIFLVFDMQNVLSCPRAEVSNFYYKSKLNVYNLTATLSSTKQVYCSLWNEAIMGRGGNDIASALIKILEAVFSDNPQLKSLVLWSDSCVPQNKNSLMSLAISTFMQSHPHIELITMKFSTPGHSCNQEIDAVHSCIERVLKKSEYYSPVSLLRLLLKVNSKKPYKIMQLKENDFKDYKTCAALYNYKLVPFSQVTTLKFSRSLLEIEYKVSHSHQEWKKVCIREYRGTRSESTGGDNFMRPPTNISVSKTIPQNKTLAIRSMFKYMPAVDQAYYNSILPK
ncbi:uncharacterized protein LOC118732366 [Rhagoletis pomonella]|uniref:uncharacterized protein LOC118732366 n=1 Tax=Rhagoletis pomonella TaxID=28610 RepID=UPI00178138F4|nr:uncharacterized protein LOC118732366 [Rhagoletis pomonella]